MEQPRGARLAATLQPAIRAAAAAPPRVPCIAELGKNYLRRERCYGWLRQAMQGFLAIFWRITLRINSED